jgi:hypothetical protein
VNQTKPDLRLFASTTLLMVALWNLKYNKVLGVSFNCKLKLSANKAGANVIIHGLFRVIYETQLSCQELTGKFTDIYFLML